MQTSSDMPGVPKKLSELSIDLSKMTKPVKQKLRRFAKDRKEVIRVDIVKLLAVGFIHECKTRFGSPTGAST
jgi:Zn-finger domain-containing protein